MNTSRGSLWQLRERRAGNWFVQPDPILHRLAAGRLHRARPRMRTAATSPTRPVSGPTSSIPLHFEPEATTLVHGSYFEDQLTVIRNLARSLPAGWELVVKEHFYMRGPAPARLLPELLLDPEPATAPVLGADQWSDPDAEVVAVISEHGRPRGGAGRQAGTDVRRLPLGLRADVSSGPRRSRSCRRRSAELAANPLGADHPDVLAFGASWDAACRARYFRTRAYDWTEPENVRRIAEAVLTRVPRPRHPGVFPSSAARA